MAGAHIPADRKAYEPSLRAAWEPLVSGWCRNHSPSIHALIPSTDIEIDPELGSTMLGVGDSEMSEVGFLPLGHHPLSLQTRNFSLSPTAAPVYTQVHQIP